MVGYSITGALSFTFRLALFSAWIDDFLLVLTQRHFRDRCHMAAHRVEFPLLLFADLVDLVKNSQNAPVGLSCRLS